MAQKKYVSLSKLSTFLDNLNNKFAALSHKHTISDIADYKPITVDSELSPTSTNPVQNKVIDAEFEAVSTAMNALEQAIDGKADFSHNHNDNYYTKIEVDQNFQENIYMQNDEPDSTPDGTLWIDLDDEGVFSSGGNVELPEVSETDNGKFLMVSDGVWSAVSLTNVAEVGA